MCTASPSGRSTIPSSVASGLLRNCGLLAFAPRCGRGDGSLKQATRGPWGIDAPRRANALKTISGCPFDQWPLPLPRPARAKRQDVAGDRVNGRSDVLLAVAVRDPAVEKVP